MLEFGFSESVASSIRDASRREGAFDTAPRSAACRAVAAALAGWRTVDCATHALAAKEPGSQRQMDAAISYRMLRLRENARAGGVAVGAAASASACEVLHVCEVLFMAVHPRAKRRGIASRLVSALRQRLLQEAAGAPAAMCVSIKSVSAEARSFWAHAGLAKLDGARSAPAPDAAIIRAMVPFDDFTPFGVLVGGGTATRRLHGGAPAIGGGAAAAPALAAGADDAFDAAAVRRAFDALRREDSDANTCALHNAVEELERRHAGYCSFVSALGQRAVDGVHIAAQLEHGAYGTLGAFCADVRGALANTMALSQQPATAARDLRLLRYPPGTAEHVAAVRRAAHQHAVDVRRQQRIRQVLRIAVHRQMRLFEAAMAGLGGACAGLPDAERWHCDALLVQLLASRGAAQCFGAPVVMLLQSDEQREAYLRAVTRPMDIGTITAKLHTGGFPTRAAFEADVLLMLDNCVRYWSAPEFMVGLQKQEAGCAAKAAVVKAITDDAKRVLDETLSAYAAAVKCLNSLNKVDIVELKSFTKRNPPGGVKLTIEVLCHMFIVKPTKKNDPDNPGKKIDDFYEAANFGLGLSSPGMFMDRLFNFDKDNIPEKVIAKIQPYLEGEDFTPAAMCKVSKACHALCIWVHAVNKHHHAVLKLEPIWSATAMRELFEIWRQTVVVASVAGTEPAGIVPHRNQQRVGSRTTTTTRYGDSGSTGQDSDDDWPTHADGSLCG